jgi:A/G-specific adenine glycosylase
MLQQTQAARVARAFPPFVERFPSVHALAAASRSEVVAEWAGLGYNRRAVALSEAARRIVREHHGVVPADPEVLARLPGIGPYTAAAVAAIACGVAVPAIDTNVRRVVARAVLGMDGVDATRPAIREAASAWMDGVDPGAWHQAVMDLGREICRPEPRCDRCPLERPCAFRIAGRPSAQRGRRPQPSFEGSFRQLRGAIVRFLRDNPLATVTQLCRASGQSAERVAAAVTALAVDGVVRAGPAALKGRPRGRVRLAD